MHANKIGKNLEWSSHTLTEIYTQSEISIQAVTNQKHVPENKCKSVLELIARVSRLNRESCIANYVLDYNTLLHQKTHTFNAHRRMPKKSHTHKVRHTGSYAHTRTHTKDTYIHTQTHTHTHIQRSQTQAQKVTHTKSDTQ